MSEKTDRRGVEDGEGWFYIVAGDDGMLTALSRYAENVLAGHVRLAYFRPPYFRPSSHRAENSESVIYSTTLA